MRQLLKVWVAPPCLTEDGMKPMWATRSCAKPTKQPLAKHLRRHATQPLRGVVARAERHPQQLNGLGVTDENGLWTTTTSEPL